MITDATHRLVSGLFIVEDHGAHPLKGVEQPLQLYRVVQPSGVRGRLEAVAAAQGLTPFVGREDELRLLLNRWERSSMPGIPEILMTFLRVFGPSGIVARESGIGHFLSPSDISSLPDSRIL